MPTEELTINLTQEELDYILKKRERESRARMKSESALKDYLKTLPTINMFLKKTGLLSKPQTRDSYKHRCVLERLVLNDPNSPMILREDYEYKSNQPELDIDVITVKTRSLCGAKFPRALEIRMHAYKNKVFYMAIYEGYDGSEIFAKRYERDPLLPFNKPFYIKPDFKTQILTHIYRVYQTSILSTENSAKVAQEEYEGYQKQVQKLKKIFGKNYNKYKNMFSELELIKKI